MVIPTAAGNDLPVEHDPIRLPQRAQTIEGFCQKYRRQSPERLSLFHLACQGKTAQVADRGDSVLQIRTPLKYLKSNPPSTERIGAYSLPHL
jgi:hypothetical protein